MKISHLSRSGFRARDCLHKSGPRVRVEDASATMLSMKQVELGLNLFALSNLRMDGRKLMTG
jgi:hypothetical protein